MMNTKKKTSHRGGGQDIPVSVRSLFENRIRVLTTWLREPPTGGEPPELAGLRTPDILNLRLEEGEAASLFFHYAARQRSITFSTKFCEAFARHTQAQGLAELDQAGVFDTFLIHELQHLGQGLTSDKYSDVPNWLAALRRIDYNADAVSVVVCHHLYDRFRPAGWNPICTSLGRARVIQMARANMETFDAVMAPFPQEKMELDRFLRFLTWHFQQARAAQWSPEVPLFDLREEPLLEADVTLAEIGLWQPPPEHLKLFLTVGLRLHRYRADNAGFAKRLIRGVLNADSRLTTKCFDEIFGLYPHLVGR